jgi:hypothetical protein
MIQTLTTAEAAYRLRHCDYADWSMPGAFAMVRYLEGLEAASGRPLEFDEAEVSHAYTEYESALAAALEYGFTPKAAPLTAKAEREAQKWLADRAILIPFDGGIIVGEYSVNGRWHSLPPTEVKKSS